VKEIGVSSRWCKHDHGSVSLAQKFTGDTFPTFSLWGQVWC